jgi:hypothetical protein
VGKMPKELKIKVYQDKDNPGYFVAEFQTDNAIYAGQGKTPFEALNGLIDELEDYKILDEG